MSSTFITMNRDHIINTTLAAFASLALVNPQPAHSEQRPKLFGFSAGKEYCQLRSYGVSQDEALSTSIGNNLASVMTETVVNTSYGPATPGHINMFEYIVRNCKQFLPQ